MYGMWKAYGSVAELVELEHHTVNHSETFKDKEAGVHTNTIEGTWNGVKQGLKARNRAKKGMELHLMEAIWRRKHESHLWAAFIDALKETNYE